MYISKFRVKNYKSFLDSGEITFTPGINIITGQNNAGKTALMQALAINFNNIPHKSSITIPDSLVSKLDDSEINIDLQITKEEIEKLIFNLPHVSIQITNNNPNQISYNGAAFFNRLEQINTLSLVVKSGSSIVQSFIDSLGKGANGYFNLIVDKNHKKLIVDSSGSASYEILNRYLLTNAVQRTYLFNAERLKVGNYQFGTNTNLQSDASNLPEVLHNLANNNFRYNKFNKYVKKIFPFIQWVGIKNKEANRVEIVVWNEDPKLEREDLVVPLTECGTGLSQVLAILYVVLTADVPKIILIDEPNSFLHPGASRKLIEILKEYPQHQFIITTHSPTIIAAANPKTIHIVKNENAQSTVTSLDINEAKGQQSYLTEIGAKLSDVFGADNILWVEGKTEEICFPKIIEKMKGVSQMGTAILGVKHTGDFEGKHAKNVFDIYKKLSEGKGLIPPAVGFIFDKEGKKEVNIKDLKRQSGNKIEFSERKMFENYLLNPDAIFEVLNIDLDKKVSLEIIKTWFESNKWEKKFIAQRYAGDKKEDDWLLHVDGAKFLTELFKALSETKVTYSKVKHSVALAEWLIENDFENSFDDYKIIFKKFLDKI